MTNASHTERIKTAELAEDDRLHRAGRVIIFRSNFILRTYVFGMYFWCEAKKAALDKNPF